MTGRRTDLVLAWSGVAFIVFFFIGLLVLAHLVPPPSPAKTALQIASIYRDHTGRTRAGLAFVFVGCIFFLTFGSAIASQTGRIKAASPALLYLQIASLGAAVLIIIFPVLIWLAAAFRPDTTPATTLRTLNDLGWLTFQVGFVPYVTWAFSVAGMILSDTGDAPLFPRWAGYLSILVALVQIPPIALVFVKTGPFAWNGLYSWWIVAIDFFTWIVVMIILTIRAARDGRDNEA